MNRDDCDWSGVTLHFLRGLPRAGKSTLAKKLVREYGGVIVAQDAVRIALYNSQYNPHEGDRVYSITALLAKTLVAAGHKYLIFDGVYAKRDHIGGMIDCVVPPPFLSEVRVKVDLVDTSPDVCIRRALVNGQGEGICKSIIRMYKTSDWDEEYVYNQPGREVRAFMEENHA